MYGCWLIRVGVRVVMEAALLPQVPIRPCEPENILNLFTAELAFHAPQRFCENEDAD